MATQNPILIKSFGADAAITGTNLAVVFSTVNQGNVILPAAAQATRFAGITQEPTATDTSNTVAVMVQGVAAVQSDGSGAINAGDDIEIANASGQVRTATVTAPATPGTQGTWNKRQLIGVAVTDCPATAGDLVQVLLRPSIVLEA